jgi:hypothetical protein
LKNDRASFFEDPEVIQILDKGRRPLCYGNCASEAVAEAKAEAEDKSGETREGETCVLQAHTAKAADIARAAAIRKSPNGITII